MTVETKVLQVKKVLMEPKVTQVEQVTLDKKVLKVSKDLKEIREY